MNKRQKIEAVFKAAYLSEARRVEPTFDDKWQSRLMGDIRRIARSTPALQNDEAPLNLFAFRLGWAMLGFAFAISSVIYIIGINSLNKTDTKNETSIWEIVDQSANAYDAALFNKLDNLDGGDAE